MTTAIKASDLYLGVGNHVVANGDSGRVAGLVSRNVRDEAGHTTHVEFPFREPAPSGWSESDFITVPVADIVEINGEAVEIVL